MAEQSEKRARERYEILREELAERGMEAEKIKGQLKRFAVEVPSWVFGEFGGGRFAEYVPPGPARDAFEKIDDAALVHRLTGAAPRVAIHVGWDKPQDVHFDEIEPDHLAPLRDYAHQQGIGLGAVNPTLFLSGTHYGSLSSPLHEIRGALIRHCKICCEIAVRYSTGVVTYWLPDGANYPGQVDLWQQEERVRQALKEIYDDSPPSVLHLIEYKLFEPGTYSTTIADAGIAEDVARAMGERAGVLVDMGHHAHGVNVAQIVARLIGRGIRGGMHFNSRYVADDDHAVEPDMSMFVTFCELVKGGVVVCEDPSRNWAHMIDQCSGLENRIRAVLHSIDSLQVSLAKALVVDRDRLRVMREEHNIIGANRVLLDAFLTDVRPMLRMARMEQGLPLDPVQAFDESGYQGKIERERG